VNQTLLWATVLLLLITNIGATGVAYYLYKWRIRTKEGDKVIVIPDEIFNRLDSNSNSITALVSTHHKENKKLVKALDGVTRQSENSSAQIIEFLSSIQKLADERLHEIERYRDGYDYSRLKIFISNIIRLIDQIDEGMANVTEDIRHSNLYELLEDVRDELIILLENNNVEQIIPEQGQAYSVEAKDYRVIGRHAPEDIQFEETIRNVVKPGYRLIISDAISKVIREAEVEIYNKFAGEGGTND